VFQPRIDAYGRVFSYLCDRVMVGDAWFEETGEMQNSRVRGFGIRW
jgi:hypothetical protein